MWRPITLGLAMLIVTCAGLIVHCRRTDPPKSVVLISIDTLNAGHLSCYGYQNIETPNIDDLAKEGALFENAVTSVPLTLPAHASIFTGRNPLRHGVVDNFTSRLSDEEETLAEILKANGYATAAFVGAFVLDSRWGTAQGFDLYFDDFETDGSRPTSPEANQRSGDEVLERVSPWVHQRSGEPFFLFVHFFDPHTPYSPPEPYRERCKAGPVSCYDGEVAFVDSLVGELVSELESLGLLDEALVILLGDHGESLGAHGESTHGFFVYDATVKVPLIMRGPEIPRSTRVRAQVRTVDLMPTILDVLELPSPSSLDGVSLRPLLLDPDADLDLEAYIESRYTLLQFGWAPLNGLRSERYKFVDAPRRELYNLRADPGETRNLAGEKRDVVARFASTLERLRSDTTSVKTERHLPDPETVERLRALGYVTSSMTGPLTKRDLADPKDKIGIFNLLEEAREARHRNDVEGALRLLESVIEEDPEVTLAHLMAGNIHLAKGEFQAAESAFRSVMRLDERNLDGLFGLALAHKGRELYREAAEELERLLELDSRQLRAVHELAEVQVAMGQEERAERLLSGLGPEEQDVSVMLTLASSLLAQQKRQEALEILNVIEKREPEEEQALLSLGSLFLRADDEERGVAAYQRAVRAPALPGARPVRAEAEVFNAVGHFLARQGDLSSSALAFGKAVERDPSHAPSHNNLGIVLARTEQVDAAEAAFRQALEKDPDFAEGYYNLGNLYLQTGKADQAIQMLRRALAIRPDYARARAQLEKALAGHPQSR